jgi:phosphoenolpyruvate carboxykinase (ATP)
VVTTRRHSGRSPRDKYIVDEDATHDAVNWGSVNQPIMPAQFAQLRQRVMGYLQGHLSADPMQHAHWR